MLEGVVAQIGQVRDDDVHRVGDRSEQISFAQLDPIGDAVAQRVLPSDDERIDADVGRDHVHGPLVRRDRDRDRARTGPHVRDGERAAGDALARGVDERFRLGARDQHSRIDREAEPVELLEAAQIRDGFAARPPFDQIPIATFRSVRHLAIGMRVQHLLRHTEHVGQEDISVERGRRDPRGTKHGYRRVTLLAPSPHLPPEVSSRRAG